MNRKYIGVIAICVLAAVGLLTMPAGAMTTSGVDVHGFISQGFLYSDEYNYLAHNSTDGSFEYNEFGINFSKDLTDKLRMGMQLFSRDIGDASNNKVTIDWAYGDYRFQDWLGVRAGRIKLPIGLYNEIRDVDMLRTSIILPQGIYNDLFRDTLIAINGAGLYGNVDLGAAGGLEYQALVGGIYSDADSGVGKYTNDGVAEYGGELLGDTDNDTSYTGAIRWETPLSGLRLGYSITSTKAVSQLGFSGGATVVNLESESVQHVGSIEFVWNDLTVVAEYMQRNSETEMGSRTIETDTESYYLLASYGFTDWFTLGAYYSVYYPRKDDKDGDDLVAAGEPDHGAWQKDMAATLRFDINEYWVFKVEGHYVDGTALVLGLDNPDNDFTEDTWYYGAAKVTFSF